MGALAVLRYGVVSSCVGASLSVAVLKGYTGGMCGGASGCCLIVYFGSSYRLPLQGRPQVSCPVVLQFSMILPRRGCSISAF